MKSDLKALYDESDSIYEKDSKISVLDKMRNSSYYVISRAMRFGLDVEHLISSSNLTANIVKDLCNEENPARTNFLCPNLI